MLKVNIAKRMMSRSLARSMALAGGRKRRRTRRRSMKGGYQQYQNNMPMTQTYSLGGHLSSENLGLANPPPYRVLSNDSSCVDNYNHYTNKGFPSVGH